MKRVRVKPGRGSSAAGFAVGLIFVGIGIFVVIPIFGVFGILWTAVAVAIAAVSGIAAFSGKGVTSHEIIIDDDGEPSALPADRDPAERLQTLRDLYDRRLITEEEYEKRRAEILSEL